jgi:hypothetical protein
MRVLVCGGRDYYDAVRAYTVLDHYHVQRPFSIVIHGAAKGADNLAAEWATTRFVQAIPFPAAWDDLTTQPCVTRYRRDGKPYNVLAGGIRNTRMLVEGKPELVIAFPGGSGTADMIRKSRMARVPVLVIPS